MIRSTSGIRRSKVKVTGGRRPKLYLEAGEGIVLDLLGSSRGLGFAVLSIFFC